MTDIIDYKILGDDMQIVEVGLDSGEGVRAEAGAMGGEGLFLAMLYGPGQVYLQSLPFSRLADRIFAASRFHQRGEQKGIAGIGGGILGGVFGGDNSF